MVHGAGRRVARRRRPQHDPRRRRRRDPARPQGRRVRGRRRRAARRRHALGRVQGHPRHAAPLAGGGPPEVHEHRGGDQGRHRGDHHRRHAALRVRQGRHAAVPGDQRQRLGHQEQVRQPLRRPALARRRHLPRHRRDAVRQDRRGLRLRRRRQGLGGVAARPGRPRRRHRDRPDLRAPGRDAGLPGGPARGRHLHRGRLHHRHRQQGHHHGRGHGSDEAPRDRGQHRALRQRDRHRRPDPHQEHRADQHQAAGRRVGLP